MLLFSTLVFSSVIAYNMRNLAMFPKEQGSDQGQLGSLKVIEVFNDFKFKAKNFVWLINNEVTFDENLSIFWSIFELIKDNEINVGPKSIIPTSTPQGIHRQSGWVKGFTVRTGLWIPDESFFGWRKCRVMNHLQFIQNDLCPKKLQTISMRIPIAG